MNQKVFVDSNIIIDFLADRFPFSESANKLFILAEDRKVDLYVSAGSFDSIYYILKRNQLTHSAIISSFKKMNRVVKMIPVDKGVVEEAIESTINDFEDAIQYYCAKKIKGLNIIISRDKRGFNHGDMTTTSAEEYLNAIR